MKIFRLEKDYKEKADRQLARHPGPKHFDKTLRADTEIVAPDGQTIAVLLRGVIPLHLYLRAFELLKPVNGLPSNRATAMGTPSLHRSTGLDHRLSPQRGVNEHVLDASPARQGILGFDRPGHETKLTVKHREMLLGNEQLIKLVDALYQKYLPTHYEKQRAVLAKFPRYRLFGVNFSTIYVAKNFRTAYHRDSGNLPGVMTCLMPMGRFTGGELVFPRWRIAVAFKSGDLLLFDPDQLHGNLPFKGERISMALYCGGWVAKCGA
jgi:hypothetical protein